MAMGDVIGAFPFRRAATNRIDARSAASATLAAYLRNATFLRWGGDDSDTAFQLNTVREEWPEAHDPLVYPSASIVDAGSVPLQSHNLIHTPLEKTKDLYGQDTVLWKLFETQIDFQVDFWTNETTTREAIAGHLPSLFGFDECTGRILLEGPLLYFSRPVRMSLIQYQRIDTPLTGEVRERRLTSTIQCEIDVVELRSTAELATSVQLIVGEGVEPRPGCES